ncbi:RNA polymerase alpha subunit C-terminal domain-containing protein [Paenibacillus sp. PL2-23]|uniref:RNA polymerase alpha subunit C-terminal domain-containing protein n=1 Tax=Paenibacillus sp. PL2-23 TaxID=2100729 RepID=UPI0030F70931
MASSRATLRTCPRGHTYYKSSDCPTCPTCEQENRPGDGFLSRMPAPARRALENEGITSIQQLSQYSEGELLKLHGMGPSSIPKLRTALAEQGLTFKTC